MANSSRSPPAQSQGQAAQFTPVPRNWAARGSASYLEQNPTGSGTGMDPMERWRTETADKGTFNNIAYVAAGSGHGASGYGNGGTNSNGTAAGTYAPSNGQGYNGGR